MLWEKGNGNFRESGQETNRYKEVIAQIIKSQGGVEDRIGEMRMPRVCGTHVKDLLFS